MSRTKKKNHMDELHCANVERDSFAGTVFQYLGSVKGHCFWGGN